MTWGLKGLIFFRGLLAVSFMEGFSHRRNLQFFRKHRLDDLPENTVDGRNPAPSGMVKTL